MHVSIMTYGVERNIYILMCSVGVHVSIMTYSVEVHVYIMTCNVGVHVYIMTCGVGVHVYIMMTCCHERLSCTRNIFTQQIIHRFCMLLQMLSNLLCLGFMFLLKNVSKNSSQCCSATAHPTRQNYTKMALFSRAKTCFYKRQPCAKRQRYQTHRTP